MKTSSFVSFVLCLLGFSALSLYVFYITFSAQPINYIDEIFHVPQARNYCTYNFSLWDPKITTLPGLYLYSVVFLSPVSYIIGRDVCNLFMLRLVNVSTAILTFCLIYYSLRLIYKHLHVQHDIILWSALNISLFPLLYYWNFFYYTEVVSFFFILLMHYYHLKHKFMKSAIAGSLSVLVRQTNIVWIGFLFLDIMNDFMHGILGKVTWKNISVLTFLKLYKKKIAFFRCLLSAKGHLLVCSLFLLFVYINKGIVVGDRLSHEAVLHLPQVFYFGLCCTFFSLPFSFRTVVPFLNFCFRYWKYMLLIFISFNFTVHFNTLVHPYLLADNRHYTFYFWKLLEKHFMFKYLLIPGYMFSIYNITYNLSHMKLFFPVIYWICIFITLVPQKLLELRYFIVPFLFYRLNLRPVYRWQLFFESVMNILVNLFVFYIFVNKQFYWPDSPDVQRISW